MFESVRAGIAGSMSQRKKNQIFSLHEVLMIPTAARVSRTVLRRAVRRPLITVG